MRRSPIARVSRVGHDGPMIGGNDRRGRVNMAADPSAGSGAGLRFTPQLFVGLIVIVVGVVMTLDNLEIIDAAKYLRFWPAALIVLGLLKIWHSRDGVGGAFAGFVFVLGGAWLLLEQTAFVRVSFWEMWPALLVAFGVFLVWQGMSGPRQRSPGGDSNALVSAMAVLGGVSRGNNSAAFRGGELTAVMGGCELDLRHAAIDGEAVLEVFALWGGIEIRVPEDWTVVSRVTAVLGGVDDKTRAPQAAARHRLVLRGFVVMAGVEIKN
jgi:predicted membrane protein